MQIVAKNISKTYNGHEALKNFSASINGGRITGLLGPNGAGKTTFIRILNSIVQADSGHVTFDSLPVTREYISHIGYLPEERGLYRKMKVLPHIIYLARLKGLSKEEALSKALHWLDKMDLKVWKNRRIEQLSKGMAQKVQFISTIIHNPEIIILDEPFSGFDPINTNIIRDEILALKEAGKTIILSTHNMNSVEEICDDIILLNEGEIVLDGALKDIRTQFRPHIYHITFKGNIIGFTNALWAGYELIDRTQLGDNHFMARIRLLNENKVNNLLNTVLEHVEIEGVEEEIPGMNEIFIKALNKDE